MIRTASRLFLCAFVLSAVAYGEAATTFYGSTQGQPTFNRPFNLSTLSGRIVRYSVQPFFPNADADCFIQGIQESDYDGVIYLYRDGFNPGSPLTNLIAYDDDGPEFGVGESRIETRALRLHRQLLSGDGGFRATEIGTFSNQVVCDAPRDSRSGG